VSIRTKVKLTIGVLMFLGGVAGAWLSHRGRIAAGEPPVVTQLSWAAIWMSGLTALIAADDGS
jgi:hypothetical protein